MVKNVWGYVLLLLLYAATLGVYLFGLSFAKSDGQKIPMWSLWVAVAFLAIWAAALFVWSLKEMRRGSRAFSIIAFLSGLYLLFALYRTAIFVSVESNSNYQTMLQQ